MVVSRLAVRFEIACDTYVPPTSPDRECARGFLAPSTYVGSTSSLDRSTTGFLSFFYRRVASVLDRGSTGLFLHHRFPTHYLPPCGWERPTTRGDRPGLPSLQRHFTPAPTRVWWTTPPLPRQSHPHSPLEANREIRDHAGEVEDENKADANVHKEKNADGRGWEGHGSVREGPIRAPSERWKATGPCERVPKWNPDDGRRMWDERAQSSGSRTRRVETSTC